MKRLLFVDLEINRRIESPVIDSNFLPPFGIHDYNRTIPLEPDVFTSITQQIIHAYVPTAQSQAALASKRETANKKDQSAMKLNEYILDRTRKHTE